MGPTRQIAEFIQQTEYKDILPEVAHQAKLLMLDTLGCALAGYTLAEEEVGWALQYVRGQKAAGPATIFCDGARTSAANAALANGVMVHTIDFDDTHMGSIAHLGAALLATTLAVGEERRASGQEVIAAFILGFDLGARLGRSVMPSHYKYWHPTATLGGIAAAAATAKLMRQDADQIEQVIGLAADAASGMRYGIEHGDFSKTLHPGFAAMKAVVFSELVGLGASGPKAFLEYPSGFCHAFSSQPNLEALVKNLGGHYEIMEDSIKSYPSIQCSHTSVTAALQLARRYQIKPEDVKEIDIVQTATVPGQGCNYAPSTPLAARLSTPFCVALAVSDGEVSLQKFTPQRIQDAKLKELMNKIKIRGSEEMKQQYPETIAAVVKLSTLDGNTYTATQIYPKGDPRNRLSDQEIKDKFTSLARLTLGQDRVARLIDQVLRLEGLTDLQALTGLTKKA